MTKKRYIQDKRLDVINDNVLDIMYFVKECMCDESNEILLHCDIIRGAMINKNYKNEEKLAVADMRFRAMFHVISNWNNVPNKVKKIVNDVIKQLLD
jgi:hypothetical protein